MQLRSGTKATFVALLLESLSLAAFAHDDHSNVAEEMGNTEPSPTVGISRPISSLLSSAFQTPLPSYFGYSGGSGFLYAHAFLMVLGWMFLLPVGVMLSIAQSHTQTPVQILFLFINLLGVVLGTIYNAKTPDLYPNNSHHKFGWALNWLVGIYILIGLLSKHSVRGRNYDKTSAEGESFLPVSVEAMEAHQMVHVEEPEHHRHSSDSGQGTERASSSIRSHSLSLADEYGDHQPPSYRRIYDEREDATADDRPLFQRSNALDRLLQKVPGLPKGVLHIAKVVYTMVNRLILVLGFVAMCTGVVTYGGIMRGNGIFNGLAHFIKGGIFLWYGVLTLGRWMGCFADLGWAWNIKPSPVVGSWKALIPPAEFVESFVIFLYGATNVFLEHLAAWGDAWTAQDLEHVSISILFFGGGLCGMLVESIRIRDLLNTTLFISSENRPNFDATSPPRTYGFSLNPTPGLIIFLVGLMMGSHHQSSAVSTMVHKQWGTLLVGFALARGITYIVVYLSPPSSILPSRPPSELIASFCLISGGLIFMASTKDIVRAMEIHNLDAMFVFTVAVGFTAFFMAWIIMVVAVKGWALRHEYKQSLKSFPTT